MKTEKGDFVLLMDPQASKPMLVEITKVKDKQLVGVLSSEDRAQQGDEKFRVSFDQSDVGVNLGASPPIGKSIMGVKIEPYIDSVQLPLFTVPTALMDTLPDNEIALIRKGAAKLAKRLKKYGALDHTRHWSSAIRPRTGKMTGQWKYSVRQGFEQMNLYAGGKDTPDWFYVMAHEFGHHIWSRCMTSKQKSRWIDRHRKAIKFSEISSSQLTRIRTELEKAKSIKAYRAQLRKLDKENDENNTERFVEVVKASLKLCHATAEDFDCILENGESLADYWVKTPIPLADRNVIITEYAMTNATELFCECLAHALTGKEMPEKLKKQTLGTFKAAIANGIIDGTKGAEAAAEPDDEKLAKKKKKKSKRTMG